ncbi:MAG: hypothetical protein ABR612_01395 [Chromatocurvus sp.]
MATSDKTTSEKQKEMDAGRESVLAAYNDMLEAQGHFRSAAEAAGLDLKNDAMDQLLKGRDKADALGEEVQRYVHEKPVATLGLAFFAGLLVSQLLSRK